MQSSLTSEYRLGGLLFVLTGVAYLTAAVSAALLPPELSADPNISPHEFWMVLVDKPTAHMIMHWSFVVVGVFGIGIIIPVANLLNGVAAGVVQYVSALAFLGFAVNARSHLMELAFDRKILADYANADHAFQEAVHVTAALALDIPDGILTLGGVGLWMAVVSLLLVRAGQISRLVAFAGMGASVFFVAGIVGYMMMYQLLIVASFIGGFLVCAPLWHIGVGSKMLRA